MHVARHVGVISTVTPAPYIGSDISANRAYQGTQFRSEVTIAKSINMLGFLFFGLVFGGMDLLLCYIVTLKNGNV